MEGSLMEEASKMKEPVWNPLLTSKDGGRGLLTGMREDPGNLR